MEMIKLNLIPPYRKEELEADRRHKVFVWQAVAVLMVALVFGAILGSFNYILGLETKYAMQTSVPKDQLESSKELEKYDEEFKEANSEITALEEVQRENIYWSDLFLELNKIVPEGIALQSVSTKKMQIFISGTAGTRDDLVALKEKLENSSCFENINFPLSNFAAKENIEFQSDFSIKDNCIKKK